MNRAGGLFLAGLALLMTVAPAGSAYTLIDEDEAHVECIPGHEDPTDPPMPPYDFTATGVCQSELTPPSLGPAYTGCITGDTTECVTGFITFNAGMENVDEADACGFTPFNCVEIDAKAGGEPQLCTDVIVSDKTHQSPPSWGFRALNCPIWLESSARSINWVSPGDLTLRNLTTGEERICTWTIERGCTVDFPERLVTTLDIDILVTVDPDKRSSSVEEQGIRVVHCSMTECIIEKCYGEEYEAVGTDTLNSRVAPEEVRAKGCYRMTATSGGVTFE